MPGFGSIAPGASTEDDLLNQYTDPGGVSGLGDTVLKPAGRFAKRLFVDLPKGLVDTAYSTPYGLRREDVTDIPGSEQPVDPLVRQSVLTGSHFLGGPVTGVSRAGGAALRDVVTARLAGKALAGDTGVPPAGSVMASDADSAPSPAVTPPSGEALSTEAPSPADRVPLRAGTAGVDWSRMNQPFGSISDPGSKVVIAAKDPRLSMTQRDLDRATDVAMSFSGGGLGTKAEVAAARAEKAAMAAAKEKALAEAKQQANQLADKYGPVGTSPIESALTVNDILHPDTPAQPARSRTVEEIAQSLQDRGQAALKNLGVEGGQITKSHPVHDEIVSRAMASEVQAAIDRARATGGKSATDWYTGSIDEAMRHAEDIWPELKDDPHQKMGLTASLAVTSQGENVANNVRLAEQAYDHFRQTGQFPTNIAAQNGEAMNGNFEKLNKLIEKLGPEGARDFLHSDFTVKELEKLGYDVGGENKGTMVKGSAILGPKIGGGFYQNLNGNYDPVTMDLWFMRGMGRLQGTLVGRPTEKPQARLENAMRGAGMQVPNDPDNLEGVARDVMRTHEADYRQNGALYKSGDKQKSELTLASERYLANLRGVNEQPLSGGHREWLRGIVNRARDILGQQGTKLTNADLQATWWYPEKELYSKLGGVDSETLNTDYASAFKDLKARRAAAAAGPAELGTVEHGPGSAAEAAIPGRAGSVGGGGQGAYAQQGQASPAVTGARRTFANWQDALAGRAIPPEIR